MSADLMEADHRFRVNADDVQTPAVALKELGEEPQENGPDLFILKEKKRKKKIRVNSTIGQTIASTHTNDKRAPASKQEQQLSWIWIEVKFCNSVKTCFILLSSNIVS